MIAILANGRPTFPDILKQAVADNQHPRTMKHDFDQHLAQHDNNEILPLPYARDPFDKMLAGLEEKRGQTPI